VIHPNPKPQAYTLIWPVCKLILVGFTTETYPHPDTTNESQLPFIPLIAGGATQKESPNEDLIFDKQLHDHFVTETWSSGDNDVVTPDKCYIQQHCSSHLLLT
jgi:hypothetical protein